MRIFTAALGLEANTFLAPPTSYQAFTDKLYLPPGEHQERPSHQTAACWVARERAKRDGFELIAGACYAAQPGGAATREAYERMRDDIL
jgi:microcystin degradation protein MlrC